MGAPPLVGGEGGSRKGSVGRQLPASGCGKIHCCTGLVHTVLLSPEAHDGCAAAALASVRRAIRRRSVSSTRPERSTPRPPPCTPRSSRSSRRSSQPARLVRRRTLSDASPAAAAGSRRPSAASSDTAPAGSCFLHLPSRGCTPPAVAAEGTYQQWRRPAPVPAGTRGRSPGLGALSPAAAAGAAAAFVAAECRCWSCSPPAAAGRSLPGKLLGSCAEASPHCLDNLVAAAGGAIAGLLSRMTQGIPAPAGMPVRCCKGNRQQHPRMSAAAAC